jgi:Methyltransferase domain
VLSSLLKAAAFSPRSLQFPNAWVGHLPFAAWLIRTIAPTTFVELGTYSGNSYFSFCQGVVEAGTPTRCFAVDTWQGDEHTGHYGEDVFVAVSTHHHEHYDACSRLLRMPFDTAVTYFSDESIDLLHIDGLHTYEAARHEFETWLPKLAPGAVVLLHDTNVRERGFGVWKVWEELKARYQRTMEFAHSNGLGVLQLNNPPENHRLNWLECGSLDRRPLIDYFAALGARQLERYDSIQARRGADSLVHTVADRDAQLVKLSLAVAARDDEIARMKAGRIWRIASLLHRQLRGRYP